MFMVMNMPANILPDANKNWASRPAEERFLNLDSMQDHFDTLREGFLDGADVRVYRITNGKFNLVREDKVAEGGFHVSGWVRAMKNDAVVPPNTTQYHAVRIPLGGL